MLKHKRCVFLPLRMLQSLILDKTGDPIYGMIVPAALSLQRADFFEVTRRMQRNRKKYRDTFFANWDELGCGDRPYSHPKMIRG